MNEHGLLGVHTVGQHTIRWRFRNNKTSGNREQSPIKEVEDLILVFVVQRQEARQPMKPREGVHFVNSLIDGKPIQNTLRDFQRRKKKSPTGRVTEKFWRGFMNRHKDKLSKAKGYRYAANRDKWLTHENLRQMYEMTYEIWVEAGVARSLPEEDQYWVNANGERVESQEEAYGLKVTVDVLHPERILFGDEVGSDVCQEGDGHIGGQVRVLFSTGFQSVRRTLSH